MSRNTYRVFSEGKIANLVLKNRLIRSATYEGAMTGDGRMTDKMLTIYRDLAEGGVGMIITGIMSVIPKGKGFPRQICIYDDSYIDDISRLADTVHRIGNDCKIAAQLHHPGRQVVHDNKDAECIGPSAVPHTVLKKNARALTIEEIRDFIDAFADAIVRVKKAGFDAVQLHAAHGYLLSSFLSPYTNRRSDHYGGSIKKRANILREIFNKAREKVGDYPILIKINCDDFVEGGIDIDSFPDVAKEIEGIGFDAIEVSGGMWDCLSRTQEELGFFRLPIPESRTRINTPEKQSYFLEYTENINLRVPVILVGGHRNIERMEKIFEKGNIDFLALCRPLISEPGLPNRWLEGRGKEKSDCVSCNACLLLTKYGSLGCMLKQSKIKQKITKNLAPHIWKMILK